MPFPTKYTNMSDADFLRLVDEVRSRSPIIEELCQRLEVYSDSAPKESNLIARICPICEGEVDVNISEGEVHLTISHL